MYLGFLNQCMHTRYTTKAKDDLGDQSWVPSWRRIEIGEVNGWAYVLYWAGISMAYVWYMMLFGRLDRAYCIVSDTQSVPRVLCRTNQKWAWYDSSSSPKVQFCSVAIQIRLPECLPEFFFTSSSASYSADLWLGEYLCIIAQPLSEHLDTWSLGLLAETAAS